MIARRNRIHTTTTMRTVIHRRWTACRWLNLTRLELTVFTDNARAIALYKRCGFEIEGTLRQYAFRDGAFVDAYGMARVQTAKEADSACIVRPV